MEKKLVSQAKVDLAWELMGKLWDRIRETLPPDQMRLVWGFNDLQTYTQYVDGTISGTKPEDDRRSFEESMSEALNVLPESDWPMETYTVYPERQNPEVLEARIRELCDEVLTALAEIPEGRRRELLSAVAGWA